MQLRAMYLSDAEEKMSVERGHEDWSRICHISHARSETTECPGARFRRWSKDREHDARGYDPLCRTGLGLSWVKPHGHLH